MSNDAASNDLSAAQSEFFRAALVALFPILHAHDQKEDSEDIAKLKKHGTGWWCKMEKHANELGALIRRYYDDEVKDDIVLVLAPSSCAPSEVGEPELFSEVNGQAVRTECVEHVHQLAATSCASAMSFWPYWDSSTVVNVLNTWLWPNVLLQRVQDDRPGRVMQDLKVWRLGRISVDPNFDSSEVANMICAHIKALVLPVSGTTCPALAAEVLQQWLVILKKDEKLWIMGAMKLQDLTTKILEHDSGCYVVCQLLQEGIRFVKA